MRLAGKQFARESRMERVAGPVSDQAAQHRLADQCKVSKQIESLMTNELIRKAKRGIVQHAGLREHDCIFQRSTPNQAAGLQFLNFMVEAEGSCGRDQVGIIRPSELDVQALFTNQGVGEINVVSDTERIGRVDAQRFLAFIKDELLGNPKILPSPTLLNDTHPGDGFNVWQGAAVEDGHFEVVEFDVRIVDAHTVECGEQVFDRRYPHAPTHQCCRIGNSRHRCDIGSKLEVVEINASKNDSLTGRRRKNSNGCMLSRMKADAPEFERVGDSLLAHEVQNIATQWPKRL